MDNPAIQATFQFARATPVLRTGIDPNSTLQWGQSGGVVNEI